MALLTIHVLHVMFDQLFQSVRDTCNPMLTTDHKDRHTAVLNAITAFQFTSSPVNPSDSHMHPLLELVCSYVKYVAHQTMLGHYISLGIHMSHMAKHMAIRLDDMYENQVHDMDDKISELQCAFDITQASVALHRQTLMTTVDEYNAMMTVGSDVIQTSTAEVLAKVVQVNEQLHKEFDNTSHVRARLPITYSDLDFYSEEMKDILSAEEHRICETELDIIKLVLKSRQKSLGDASTIDPNNMNVLRIMGLVLDTLAR